MVINYKNNLSTKWWVLAAMGAMLTMINLDFSAMNLALAPIAKDLNAHLASLQWVVNGFMIAAAAFVIASGRFSDILGKRKLFICGAVIFIAASLFAGYSTNIWVLIVARVFQGIGVSITNPIIMVIAFETFPDNQKSIAVGILSGIIGISQAIGPSLGGFLIHYLSWRWIFFINIPIGLISISLTLLFYHEGSLKEVSKRPTITNVIAIVVFLSMFIFGLNQVSQFDVTSKLVAIPLLISLFAFIFFIYKEIKAEVPLIDYTIFNKNFIIFIAMRGIFIGFGFTAIIFLFGLYFQNILSINAINAGLLLLFVTVSDVLITICFGFFLNKKKFKSFNAAGMLLASIGFILIIILPLVSNSWIMLAIPLFIMGSALGIVLLCCLTATLSSVPENKTGRASGIYYTCSFLGMAVSVAIIGFLMNNLSAIFLHKLLNKNNIALSVDKMGDLLQIVNGSSPITQVNKIFSSELSLKILPIVKNSFIYSFDIIMGISAFLCIAGFVISFFIKKNNLNYSDSK